MRKVNSHLNNTVTKIGVYKSAEVLNAVTNDPSFVNWMYGVPYFGPPDFATQKNFCDFLNPDYLARSCKTYEASLGSASLRRAISQWYLRHYALDIDPEDEILVTQGAGARQGPIFS